MLSLYVIVCLADALIDSPKRAAIAREKALAAHDEASAAAKKKRDFERQLAKAKAQLDGERGLSCLVALLLHSLFVIAGGRRKKEKEKERAASELAKAKAAAAAAAADAERLEAEIAAREEVCDFPMSLCRANQLR